MPSCIARPRRRKKLLLCVVAVMLGSGGLLVLVLSSSMGMKACSNADSIKYLESLCFNFTTGAATGSICRPLCDTKEIMFQGCLGHGVKMHVLEAEWNGMKVVLKTPKPLGTNAAVVMTNALFPNTRKEDIKMPTLQFVYHLRRHLYLHLVGVAGPAASPVANSTISRVARTVANECDVGGDEMLHYWELITCWQLVATEEFVLYSILHGNSAALDVYGTCGNMYAVQYAAAQPFLGFQTHLSDKRSWEFRASLAVALLDMVEALETTAFGTLYLCDVQEANFGVVRDRNGRLKAKAIDVDIAIFEPTLVSDFQNERNRACSEDSECFIFCCGSKCNQDTGQCTGVVTSSNLITLCNRILMRRHRLHAALLSNPPHHLKGKLDTLLQRCSEYGPAHNDVQLMRELRHLLEQK